MTTPTLADLRNALELIGHEYALLYAGFSRITREVEPLDSMLERLQAAVTALEAGAVVALEDERQALLTDARSSLALYTSERALVLEAKAMGPEVHAFAELEEEASLVSATYRRHFEGQARATRDLGLLAEMIADLDRLLSGMEELQPSLPEGLKMEATIATVRSNRALYGDERGAVVEARGADGEEEQAGVLAEVANGQFQTYRDHFAGKARVTRRPQLLQRIIDNLTVVLDRMTMLKAAGFVSEWNEKNIEVVQAQLAHYRTELNEVRAAREALPLTDLQVVLGGAANEIMGEYGQNYAGMSRRACDLGRLGVLCDLLAEVRRQMAELGWFFPTDVNTRNLRLVTDHRALLEREWVAVRDAKATAEASP